MRSATQDHSRRYLVVSDFHMTSGKDSRTGRWSPTEDFFWDEAFQDFLLHHTDGVPTTLIVNGDFFDFLQVLVFPTDDEQETYGIPDSEINHTYGLQCSEPSCEFQIEKIMDGHEVSFRALADFLVEGNQLKILNGNHDIQLVWPKVQRRIRERLESLGRSSGTTLAADAVEFLPWLFYVRGLLFVEHGNQYEATTAFRNLLYPRLPVDGEEANPQLELDLSSFLVRYLTNRVEPVNPLADNIRPLTKYYDVLLQAHPYLVARTLGTAFRFVLKAFEKARRLKHGFSDEEYQKIIQANECMIGEEAVRFGGDDPDQIKRLDADFRSIYSMMKTPTLHRGAWNFLGSMTWYLLKRVAWLLPLYVLTLLPDLALRVVELAGLTKIALLMSIAEWLYQFNLLHLIIVAVAGYLLIKIVQLFGKRKGESGSEVFPDVSLEMREHARKIAGRLNVKIVTFGHTHYADTCPLSGASRYFNTGTWMGVFEEAEQLYRDVRQFSFLCVENGTGKLLRWNPEKKDIQEVVVVDTVNPLTDKEDGILKLIVKALKR